MPRYQNLSGKSNVVSYEETEDTIEVTFGGGERYLYTEASVGAANLAEMKRLAAAGRGLNSFVNRKVRKLYARKL